MSVVIKNLKLALPPGGDRPYAVDDVSFELTGGKILCVVGESGSGKSVMANAIMRLLPNEVSIDAGRVMFEGRDLATATTADMRAVRGDRRRVRDVLVGGLRILGGPGLGGLGGA